MALAFTGLVVLPGIALAAPIAKVSNQTIVEGHTVYAAVEKVQNIEFAAIAGIARERLVVKGVFWFNDQELFGDIVLVDNANGHVLAVEAGDPDPTTGAPLSATYIESYMFTDPNDRGWIVDRYFYVSGGINRSVFVVDTGIITVDTAPCNPASPGGTGCPTNKPYNFVVLVRMDALRTTTAAGKAHPSAADDTLKGDSHDTQGDPVAAHTHRTDTVDLYFASVRPATPLVRNFLFTDLIGSAAPWHSHP